MTLSSPAPPSPEQTKLELESAKLRAEIRDLNARFPYEDAQRVRERHWTTVFRTNWLPTVLAVVGFVLAVVGFVPTFLGAGVAVWTYLKQQERQLDSRLSESQSAIDLVKQLRSQDHADQETAALLLTAFGRDAVPALVMSLTFPTTTDPDPIIRALRLIKTKRNVSPNEDVVDPLLDRAREMVNAAVLDVQADVDVVLHLIRAVGILAPRRDQRALDLFALLEQRLKAEKVSRDNYNSLAKEINDARSRLDGSKRAERHDAG
jgi:hypothetical protein